MIKTLVTQERVQSRREEIANSVSSGLDWSPSSAESPFSSVRQFDTGANSVLPQRSNSRQRWCHFTFHPPSTTGYREPKSGGSCACLSLQEPHATSALSSGTPARTTYKLSVAD